MPLVVVVNRGGGGGAAGKQVQSSGDYTVRLAACRPENENTEQVVNPGPLNSDYGQHVYLWLKWNPNSNTITTLTKTIPRIA